MVRSWIELRPGYCSPSKGSQAGSKDRIQVRITTRRHLPQTLQQFTQHRDSLASSEEHLVRCRECAGSLGPWLWATPPLDRGPRALSQTLLQPT